MSDVILNKFVASGTAVERAAFTPDPPTPGAGPDHGYFWFETDTGALYAWNPTGPAWELVTPAGGGITQLTGDVTAGPGVGSQAATIANDSVTNAKAANMAAERIKGRAVGAGTGDPTDLTPDQVSAILDNASDPFLRASAAGGPGTAAWGDLYPNIVAPVDGDFAWINQGDASVASWYGGAGIFFEAPANGSHNVRVRKQAAPATPYTVTAMFLPRLLDVVAAAGLCFRQSSDGKLHTFGVAFGGVRLLASQKHTSPTAFSANYTTVAIPDAGAPLFLRIADDGSNRICSWSTDGQHFVAVHTVGRTDFLTADEVGFFITPSSTVVSGMTLLSWREA